ncbi:MAG: DUF6285 domain-containing protein [Mycobacteriales bacterium]
MSMYGRPSAAELAAAAAEYLRDELLPTLEGRQRFQVLVTANVLGVIHRELTLGPGHETAQAGRLADLGVRDDAELSAQIRAGRFDERVPELLQSLRESVRAKLEVANPKYFTEEDSHAAR